MIQPRGKRTDAHGERVQRTIEVINKLFKTEPPIALWYIEDETVRMTATGNDYGCLVHDKEAGTSTIFIAAHHEPEKIAGSVALQYAHWLQHHLGIDANHQDAVTFAKYVTGRSPVPPFILETYADRYPDAPNMLQQGITIQSIQEAEEVDHD